MYVCVCNTSLSLYTYIYIYIYTCTYIWQPLSLVRDVQPGASIAMHDYIIELGKGKGLAKGRV